MKDRGVVRRKDVAMIIMSIMTQSMTTRGFLLFRGQEPKKSGDDMCVDI